MLLLIMMTATTMMVMKRGSLQFPLSPSRRHHDNTVVMMSSSVNLSGPFRENDHGCWHTQGLNVVGAVMSDCLARFLREGCPSFPVSGETKTS